MGGRLRLPPEVGALFVALLDAEVAAGRDEDGEDERRSMEQRRADAFVVLLDRLAAIDHTTDNADTTDLEVDSDTGNIAETIGTADNVETADSLETVDSVETAAGVRRDGPRQVRRPAGPGRATPPKRACLVIVHRYPGGAEINGKAIPVTTAERLACDSFTVPLDHDRDRNPLNFGRTRRTPTAAQRRAVAARDRSCRFNGCGSRKGLHAHHVAWWGRDHGPTDLGNLIYLCDRHHRAVHDRHWRIIGTPDGHVEFVPPDRTGPLRPAPIDFDELISTITDPLGPIRPTAGAGDRFHLDDAVWAYFHNDHVANTGHWNQPQPTAQPHPEPRFS